MERRPKVMPEMIPLKGDGILTQILARRHATQVSKIYSLGHQHRASEYPSLLQTTCSLDSKLEGFCLIPQCPLLVTEIRGGAWDDD